MRIAKTAMEVGADKLYSHAMGQVHDSITGELRVWLQEQKVFFVATAPLAKGGHINCSPKGGDAFRVVDESTVAYQDYTGSGAETIAHIRENGRLVIMFCAFDGPPRIVRLYGQAEVVLPAHPHYGMLSVLFPRNPGTRAIIRLPVTRVSESCGMSAPLLDFKSQRHDLDAWAEEKGSERLRDYRLRKNQKSIDGLPALDP